MRVSQVSRSWADTLRSTALVNPAGPGPDSERTRSTLVLIAAWGATRIPSS